MLSVQVCPADSMDVVDDVFLCIVGLALSWWQQLG